MKNCPICGEEVPEDALRCSYCGELLLADGWCLYASRFFALSQRDKDRAFIALSPEQQAYFHRVWEVVSPLLVAATELDGLLASEVEKVVSHLASDITASSGRRLSASKRFDAEAPARAYQFTHLYMCLHFAGLTEKNVIADGISRRLSRTLIGPLWYVPRFCILLLDHPTYLDVARNLAADIGFLLNKLPGQDIAMQHWSRVSVFLINSERLVADFILKQAKTPVSSTLKNRVRQAFGLLAASQQTESEMPTLDREVFARPLREAIDGNDLIASGLVQALGVGLKLPPEPGAVTDRNAAKKFQFEAPNVFNAWTHMVPKLGRFARGQGKSTFFGRDKGSARLHAVRLKLTLVVLGLYADGLLPNGATAETCLFTVIESLLKFKAAFPNWMDAYAGGYELLVQQRETTLQILALIQRKIEDGLSSEYGEGSTEK